MEAYLYLRQRFVADAPLAARGDALWTDMSANSFGTSLNYDGTINNDASMRGMATFGLEARYPILFTALHSNHVIEPIAQIFVRPNEGYAGELPNEDSQAFVLMRPTFSSATSFRASTVSKAAHAPISASATTAPSTMVMAFARSPVSRSIWRVKTRLPRMIW